MVSSTEKKQISISTIDGTLTGITTPGQSEPGCNDNEGVFHIA